jgi:hypothetical protein
VQDGGAERGDRGGHCATRGGEEEGTDTRARTTRERRALGEEEWRRQADPMRQGESACAVLVLGCARAGPREKERRGLRVELLGWLGRFGLKLGFPIFLVSFLLSLSNQLKSI